MTLTDFFKDIYAQVSKAEINAEALYEGQDVKSDLLGVANYLIVMSEQDYNHLSRSNSAIRAAWKQLCDADEALDLGLFKHGPNVRPQLEVFLKSGH